MCLLDFYKENLHKGNFHEWNNLISDINETILTCTNEEDLYYSLINFYSYIIDVENISIIRRTKNDNIFIDMSSDRLGKELSINYIPCKEYNLNIDYFINKCMHTYSNKKEYKVIFTMKELLKKEERNDYKDYLDYILIPLTFKNSIECFVFLKSTSKSIFNEPFIVSSLNSINIQIACRLKNMSSKHNCINEYNIEPAELLTRYDTMLKMINNSLDILCITTIDGHINQITPSCKKILNYDMNYLVGKNIFDYVHKEHRKLFQKEFKDMLINNKEKNIKLLFRNSQNEYVWLECLYKCIYDCHNKINGVIFSLRDISDKKKAEELSKKMEENNRILQETLAHDKLRAEFFADISHELRTPINVMYSALQLLNLELNKEAICSGNSKLLKRMDIIKQNCFRLMKLINNLIDSTKIDAGYYKLNLVNCNIVSIVENITLSVSEYVENKGLNLIFDTDIEEKFICCDPEKIERIMLNLISNAVKFTENGSIKVEMKNVDDSIYIYVKDTGIGISKDKRNIIFQRFIQADKHLKGEKEGSGIGLSLVNSLVNMHHGEISVKSELGIGSTFIIKLPCRSLDSPKCCKHLAMPILDENKIDTINIEFSDIYI
ncbi:PAS domain-containing sensor histidine kinase [Hathewaya histolytica]|uniref:histidine kinase n=1 Tax=Hathewaya histolytica TaxID=1498 RepID=A0A4U9R0H1_HATHI|nr:PAS domain-containing sensor histidine kinase [Hathewaya histolytica]VTQ83383.1 sensory transduction histidine kinase [Hathewaya histolytica]